MTDEVDAIVVGAGINGMVAAAELAKAGWSVTLVDANDRLGGFIAGEERTLPGYLHDTYSSWHPMFVSSPAYAALGDDLHAHGLNYRNTDDLVTASVSGEGRVAVAHRDPGRTAENFELSRDRDAYRAMLKHFESTAGVVGGLMSSELRSWRAARTALPLLRRRRTAERMLREVATSARGYMRREFDGWEVDQLWTPWLLHTGLGPDHAGGGFMLPVLAATVHGFGLPVVEGGAGQFVAAFSALLDSLGVRVLLSSPVERIVTERGRAIGILVNGKRLRARKAVVASVTPEALYGELLEPDVVHADLRAEAARFRSGRAAMQVHVALSSPPQWTDKRLEEVPVVHMSDGAASTGIACAQAEAELLPSEPTIVVGQQAVLDPQRVPEGAASLWLQLQELPRNPRGDAAGLLDAAGWSGELGAAFGERALDRVAAHAPGLRSQVRAVDVLTPVDLEAANRNALAGDPYGGSAELDQNLLWRPIPRAARHRTPVRGLWHIGASTHPGPGLAGASGHLVAGALTGRKK